MAVSRNAKRLIRQTQVDNPNLNYTQALTKCAEEKKIYQVELPDGTKEWRMTKGALDGAPA